MVENDDCREIADETDDRMKNETHPVQARQKAEQGENWTISLEIDRLTWVDIAVSTNQLVNLDLYSLFIIFKCLTIFLKLVDTLQIYVNAKEVYKLNECTKN